MPSGGCASTSSTFHTIESRATQKIIKLQLNANLSDSGPANEQSSRINLEMFRAKIMNTTSIRFVEANADAAVSVAFGPATFNAFLGYFDPHTEQRYTMRITENSGRVIYIVSGSLIGRYEGDLASELRRVFVEQVIPVLEGNAPRTSEAAPGQIQRM